ncbi:hypothetical protein [Mucilaginibacter pedocola]|uniref:Uncharacterized protein n=1 Tax=Mucilaginibacter pedocola TaxID=1792845 RepID=A0A1S9PH22_9SPHI|nr:hypothetical protein [Mucilaginibacter pedocola]OOQ60227.1 hypothetical protein BC343_26070 [Mucilaginibacter pedocola]
MNPDEQNHHHDEQEALRMENEFLKLKLQAEHGAQSFTSGNLPPEVEHSFLKNIMEFESAWASNKRTKIAGILGNPQFPNADSLSDGAIDTELEKVTSLLAEHHIALDFLGEYPNRLKYAFIIDELFEHEGNGMMMPGMTTHFIYEEFHPNHELDIRNRTEDFLRGWFKRDMKGGQGLSHGFIVAGNIELNKEQVVQRFKNIFNSYRAFTNAEYVISNIRFEFKGETGMGHAEGLVKYTAILENGEEVIKKGPFKIYLSNEYDWWTIFSVVFPGFE